MKDLLDVQKPQFWGILILLVIAIITAGLFLSNSPAEVQNKKAALEICKQDKTNPVCLHYFPLNSGPLRSVRSKESIEDEQNERMLKNAIDVCNRDKTNPVCLHYFPSVK